MIFQHTWKMILSGQKSVTRRLVQLGEYCNWDADLEGGRILEVYTASGRLKWRVGDTYAVQSGRGMPTLRRDSEGRVWFKLKDGWMTTDTNESHVGLKVSGYKADSFKPIRIRLTAVRRERLQGITEADAEAEGMDPIGFGLIPDDIVRPARLIFSWMWKRIHTALGTTWDDNPEVWCLSFCLAEVLHG